METHYTWKSRFFRSRFEIYQYENLVGELKNKSFERRASGELNGRKLMFETKGFFNQEHRIIDQKDDSVVVQIIFNTWKTKTTIRYDNKDYQWHYDNFWNTKWSISNENGALIRYKSSFSSGEITSYTGDEVLILTGLFIKNYFKQRAAAAAAAT
jgi:hypothetical protein